MLQDVNKEAVQYGCFQFIETNFFVTKKNAVFLSAYRAQTQSNSVNIVIILSS